jgi:putative phage-type endonuclease
MYPEFTIQKSGLSEKDQELRRSGIGSSEAAAILGVNPFLGKHGLWLLKTGRAETEVTEQMIIGNCYEPAILSVYAMKTGYRLENPPTVRHEKFPYIVDSVDALAYSGDSESPVCAVEVKRPTVFGYSKYGEPGTDQIPMYYIVQGLFHMGVHGVDVCEYPVDFGYGEIRVYRTHFDKELFLGIAAECEKFWVEHIEADVEPEKDGSAVTKKWLDKKYSHRSGEMLVADYETEKLMRELAGLKEKEKQIKDAQETIKNSIKDVIGDNHGIKTSDGQIKYTWSVNKNNKRIFR